MAKELKFRIGSAYHIEYILGFERYKINAVVVRVEQANDFKLHNEIHLEVVAGRKYTIPFESVVAIRTLNDFDLTELHSKV